MRVLIVEDDVRIANFLKQGLEEEGYQVVTAQDGVSGLELAQAAPFGVIILDLMLPELDGYEVAKRLRREFNQTPILVLTARDSNQDIIRGLDLGADDYLTKPFALDVLMARVRAVSRRGPVPMPVIVRIGDLELDPLLHHASRAGQLISLTPLEFRLLEFLARSSPRVIPRNTILEEIWGYNTEVSPNNLEAFMHQLRTKIDRAPLPKLIHTVRGIGYCLREEA
jgi:two-component system copper resistance phosphate regulon response regulator CusR/two-component system response regulator MprA